jgi:hypothetical protein
VEVEVVAGIILVGDPGSSQVVPEHLCNYARLGSRPQLGMGYSAREVVAQHLRHVRAEGLHILPPALRIEKSQFPGMSLLWRRVPPNECTARFWTRWVISEAFAAACGLLPGTSLLLGDILFKLQRDLMAQLLQTLAPLKNYCWWGSSRRQVYLSLPYSESWAK